MYNASEMVSLWTIIISLITSMLGGLVAAWFVLRKTTFDNKRLAANQIHWGFKVFYTRTIHLICDLLELRGLSGIEYPGEQDWNDSIKIREFTSKFRDWLNTKADKPGDSTILSSGKFDELLTYLLKGEVSLRSFINKFPMQTSYFDMLYDAMGWADALSENIDTWRRRAPSPDFVAKYFDKSFFIPIIDIVEKLTETYVDIQHYRETKQWSWRLIIPWAKL